MRAELLKVRSLICRSLRGEKGAYSELKNLSLSLKEAERMRAVFVALIKHLAETGDYITYGELSEKANSLYPNAELPVRGGVVARVLGQILGELSTISYCSGDFLISVAVVSKGTHVQGTGFEELARLLGADLNKKDEWFRRAVEIARELEGG